MARNTEEFVPSDLLFGEETAGKALHDRLTCTQHGRTGWYNRHFTAKRHGIDDLPRLNV
jgi:hypothetical protein